MSEVTSYFDDAKGDETYPRKRGYPTTRRIYYWLCAIEKIKGVPIVDGPYNTDDEARRIGFEKIKDDFEVIPLNTRDRHRATAMFRHMRLMRYGQLSEVLKRTKHKL